MGKFEIAYAALFQIEGVYSNNSNDSGGETVYGWARNYHKDLTFWPIIDQLKKQHGTGDSLKKAIIADKRIKEIAMEEYKKEFWDIWGADNLPYSLSLELFEQGVNLGLGGCTKNLQTILNALNYITGMGSGGFGPDLKVDGVYGKNTKARFDAIYKKYGGKVIQYALNCEQGAYYRYCTEKNNEKRMFYRGWIQNRCDAEYSDTPDGTPVKTSDIDNDTTSKVTQYISEDEFKSLKDSSKSMYDILNK